MWIVLHYFYRQHGLIVLFQYIFSKFELIKVKLLSLSALVWLCLNHWKMLLFGKHAFQPTGEVESPVIHGHEADIFSRQYCAHNLPKIVQIQ